MSGVNSLNALMKTPILESVEAAVQYLISLPDQDLIHLLRQITAGGIPLSGGILDQSFRYSERVVVREFPRSSPVKE